MEFWATGPTGAASPGVSSRRRPDWGAVLVDLREHGDSLGLRAPHPLHAADGDLAELERSLALPIGGAIGHSFGGKVVLEWLRSRANQSTEAWVIDASPSPSDADRDASATAEVIRTLDGLPRSWPSREAFVAALPKAGQPRAIAEWLAMNLVEDDDGGRRFGPELSVIRDLIEDYARTDCWDIVEAPPPGCTLGLVIGGRSEAFSPSDRDRARTNRRAKSAGFDARRRGCGPLGPRGCPRRAADASDFASNAQRA